METPAVLPRSSEGGGESRPVRMFCVKDGRVIVADVDHDSHYNWFKKEGWIRGDGGSEEDAFFHHVLSGYYLRKQNALYCFRESDIGHDPELEALIAHHMLELKRELGLDVRTSVFKAPPNTEEDPKHMHRHYIGTVRDIIKHFDQDEPTIGG